MLRPYATRNADHYFENLLAIKILKNHSSRQIFFKNIFWSFDWEKKDYFFQFSRIICVLFTNFDVYRQVITFAITNFFNKFK